jgi:O-succinylbenzoate synthase
VAPEPVEPVEPVEQQEVMHLAGVELLWLDLDLRREVGTAAGTHRARPLVVVRVVADRAEGWGECAALAGGTAVDPDAGTVWAALEQRAVPRLAAAARRRGGMLPAAPVVNRLLGEGPVERVSGAALEMAVLDAELRATGASLSARLGVGLASVAAGGLAGIPSGHDLGALLDAVGDLVGRGYGRVRLKIEPGWDARPLTAVRERHPDLGLQADANGAYRLGSDGDDGPQRLVDLDPVGLTCIEQPLPPGDLPGHAALAAMLETPVCLDESLTSPAQLRAALRYGACEVACLKPARLGGLLAARRSVALCAEAGVPAFVGGFFEAGLGRAANAAVAGLAGFTLPGDLGPPAEYLVEDPFGAPDLVGGRVPLWAGAGVGPALADGGAARAGRRVWHPVGD